MTDYFHVDAAQLHRHASEVLAVRDQLAAITGASQAIAQDGAAYGLLCQWISGILEARHQAADELFTVVSENLQLAADALNATANDYDGSDSASAERIAKAGQGLG